MAKNDPKTMQVADQEMVAKQDLERTRERQCFSPKTDIYETSEEIVLIADLPGVNQASIDITLEKNILTIDAFHASKNYEGFSVAYSEYIPGDFQRQFRLSGEIDQEKIMATVTDGVLRLVLPKADLAKVKKIPIKAGK